MFSDIFVTSGTSGDLPSTRVILVAVPNYAAQFVDGELTSSICSFDRLAEYWKSVGLGAKNGGAFCPEPRLASVHGVILPVGDAVNGRVFLSALYQKLQLFGPHDTLIFHWIGHGSFLKSASDHILYLPGLHTPGDMETLEAIRLARFTDWVGAHCRARTQLFLVDCCSTPPHQKQKLVDAFPNAIEDAMRGPKQAIIVGSGVDQAAFGRDGEASLFTNGIIGAFDGLAAAPDGTIATGRRFTTALASIAKAEWLTRRFPEFPLRALRPGLTDWTQDFVQDVQPHCRHFAPQFDMRLGTSSEPRVHCCITYRDPVRRLRAPFVKSDPPIELRRVQYVDCGHATDILWAWVGHTWPDQRIRASLIDDQRETIGEIDIDTSRAVVDASFP